MKIRTGAARRLSTIDLAFGLLITTVLIGVSTGASLRMTSLALMLAFALMWRQPTEMGRLWYAATIGLPLPQSAFVSRLSVADLFVLPVISHELLNAMREGRALPCSTMTRPLALLLMVFAVGTWIGYERTGHLSSWVIFNKDAGLIFLIAVFAALTRSMRVRGDAVVLARWFVGGVSAANVPALLAVVASFWGFKNRLYDVGNFRFFGWMENPSVTGGLLLAAAMIGLGILAAPAEPGQRQWPRWAALWLIGIGLALTLSRSTWLSLAFGALVLLSLLVIDAFRTRQWRWTPIVSAAVWCLAPTLMMVNIAALNLSAGTLMDPRKRMVELRETLVGQCTVNPTLDICKDVLIPRARTTTPPNTPPVTDARPASPSDSRPAPAAPAPAAVAPAHAVPDVSGPLMNARGFNDRTAIVRSGWNQYTATIRSRILGIGLGTFYASSDREFGVPLIIHNTFAWFLVELGPLGLFAVLWIWFQTARNLLHAGRVNDTERYLAFGALAAFAGLSVFCLFNEGFYQRQVWLIIVIADRLRMLPVSTPARKCGATA